jgi:hypothetical protein
MIFINKIYAIFNEEPVLDYRLERLWIFEITPGIQILVVRYLQTLRFDPPQSLICMEALECVESFNSMVFTLTYTSVVFCWLST